MCKNECVCDGLNAAAKEEENWWWWCSPGLEKNERSGGVPYLFRETFEEIEKEKKTKWEMWSFLFGSRHGEPHFSVNETLKCSRSSQKTWLVFITPCSFL